MIESPAGAGQPAQPEQAAVQMADRVQLVVRQAAQIQSSAKSFAAAAGSGFHIEPQAAATLIKSCTDSLDELSKLQQDLMRVGQAPKLGTTPGAQVVSPFTQNAATDPRGVQPAIENLQQTLHDMIQAYKQASTNYEETNALVQQAMTRTKGSLK
jgi:hypothetical protein